MRFLLDPSIGIDHDTLDIPLTTCPKTCYMLVQPEGNCHLSWSHFVSPHRVVQQQTFSSRMLHCSTPHPPKPILRHLPPHLTRSRSRTLTRRRTRTRTLPIVQPLPRPDPIGQDQMLYDDSLAEDFFFVHLSQPSSYFDERGECREVV
jgi:hypothetical protein